MGVVVVVVVHAQSETKTELVIIGAKLVRNLTGSFSHCQFSECNQKRPQSSQTSHNLVGILSDKYDNKVTF